MVDDMVAVVPDAGRVDGWDRARADSIDAADSGPSVGGPSGRKFGQLPVCWAPRESDAVALAHDQFRWSASGWSVNAELPGPAAFKEATRSARPDDVAEAQLLPLLRAALQPPEH